MKNGFCMTTLKKENGLRSIINIDYKIQYSRKKNFGQNIKLNFILGLMKILTERKKN